MGAGNTKEAANTDGTPPKVYVKTKQAVLVSTGCWLGNIQCPLLPDYIYSTEELAKKSPFLQIKVYKRLNPTKTDDVTDFGTARIWLETEHLKYCSFNIFRQEKKTGDLINITSVALPPPNKIDEKTGQEIAEYVEETEEEHIINERTRRQFKFDNMKINETVSYIIYIVNNDPVEGQFKVMVNNMSMYHELTVLLPRQFNCEWFEQRDMTLETDIKGQWLGFSSYGGAPSNKTDNDWLMYNPAYVVSVTDPTKCIISMGKSEMTPEEAEKNELTEEEKLQDFGMGIVILNWQKDEEANYELKNIDYRVVAHSIFPVGPESENAEMRCILVSGWYHIIVCPQKKRRVGKLNVKIRSNLAITGERQLKPRTTEISLSSVWMNKPLPKHIQEMEYKIPVFTLTLETDSYVNIRVTIPFDQNDNESQLHVDGVMSLKDKDYEIRSWDFTLHRAKEGEARTPKVVAIFRRHLKAGIVYTLIPSISTFSTNRDVIFNISAEALLKSGLKFTGMVNNPKFFFRNKKDLIYRGLPVDQGARVTVTGIWNLHNTTGEIGTHDRLDDAPQYIMALNQGATNSDTLKVRFTLERVGEKWQPMVLYVYDIEKYMKQGVDLQTLIEKRFSFRKNGFVVPLIGRSEPTKGKETSTSVEVNVQCDWKTMESRYLLVLPCTAVEGREGEFKLEARCWDDPGVDDRTVHLHALSDTRYNNCIYYKGSWIKGCSGGNIGDDLFAYNPCFEVKVSQPHTQLLFVLHNVVEKGAVSPDVRPRVALFLFDNNEDLSEETLRCKCKWTSYTNAILAKTISPEIHEGETMISHFLLVISTFQEGIEASYELKLFSSKPITSRQL